KLLDDLLLPALGFGLHLEHCQVQFAVETSLEIGEGVHASLPSALARAARACARLILSGLASMAFSASHSSAISSRSRVAASTSCPFRSVSDMRVYSKSRIGGEGQAARSWSGHESQISTSRDADFTFRSSRSSMARAFPRRSRLMRRQTAQMRRYCLSSDRSGVQRHRFIFTLPLGLARSGTDLLWNGYSAAISN